MKGVLLLAHGSNRDEANRMILELTARLRADLATELIEEAFLQLAPPDIATGLTRLIQRGCTEVFVLSLFLVSGNHHARDSGAGISRFLEGYPGTSFTISEPLLLNPGLYHLVASRIERELRGASSPPDVAADIEKQSFQIVEAHLRDLALPPAEMQVARRVVHATADPAFAATLVFHPGAVAAGVAALRQGRRVLVDVQMVAAGLDRKRLEQWGSQVETALQRPMLAEQAREAGVTRTQLAMRLLLRDYPDGIVAVGNAPTALEEVLEAVAAQRASPALVIGVPVGFVGAAEAKERLTQAQVPFITNRGPRGGSPVAVAMVNAILRLATTEEVA
ncbi:MAG: precorrin-8X methylmutase [Chloroflexi bacterium]|nr:precorrin-8X methylmutase [Chloroflexota bacterium]